MPRDDSLPVIPESQRPIAANSSNDATPLPTPAYQTPTASTTPRELAPPPLNKSPSNISLSTGNKTPKEKAPRSIPAWEPPPLFKAYPQALKHANLPTPNLSSETILRIDGHRKTARNGQSTVNVDLGGEHNEAETSSKKKGERIKKHARKLSDHINKAEWSQKIYMLVTSGYLLQYCADGSFNRQPEKIMELGKNSVAFASDVIPGKHWVLQVSQTVEGKNTVTFDTRRTFFSRLGLADARKATKSMFLVFDTPDELASWLIVMRREIECLGGKEVVSESPSEEKLDLHRFSNFRVNRNSARFEQPRPAIEQPPPVPNSGQPNRYSIMSASNLPEKAPPQTRAVVDRTNMKQTIRRSVIQRPSTEASSVSTLGTPTELDRLRDGSRLSHFSTGTKTMSSSRGSSPGPASGTPRTMTFPKMNLLESPQRERATIVPPPEPSLYRSSYVHPTDENGAQHTVGRLRNGSQLSHFSTGTKTMSSSRGSSPGAASSTPRTPRTMTFPKGTLLESPQSERGTIVPPPEPSLNRPSYTHSADENGAQHTADRSRPYVGSITSNHSSKPTPNFSVPGFSRRYSTAIRSPPTSSHGNHPTIQSPEPMTSVPTSPVSTQFISTGNRTVSAPFHHTTPRSSSSIRQRTPTVNEEMRASSALTSCSELSDADVSSSAPKRPPSRARRATAYEASLKQRRSFAKESIPESPKQRNNIDFLSQAIREVNLKEDPPPKPQPEDDPENYYRPFSMQFSSPTHHQDQEGVTFEILSPRSRVPARQTNTNPPRPRYYATRNVDTETDSRRNSSTTLASQRSMPNLSRGPPAPPPDCPLPQVPSHINPAESPVPPPNYPPPQIPLQISPAESPLAPPSEYPPPHVRTQINPVEPPPAPPPNYPLPQIPSQAQSPPLRRTSQRSHNRVNRWIEHGDVDSPDPPSLEASMLSYGREPNDERAKRESMVNAF